MATKTYIEGSPQARSGEERLDPAAREEERVQLRLRLVAGVPLEELDRSERTITELTDAGLVLIVDGALVLTRRGLLLQSEVAIRLGDAPRPLPV